MQLREIVVSLPKKIVDPGPIYARLLGEVRRLTGADRAVLALRWMAGRGRWTSYTHDDVAALQGAEVRTVMSLSFIENVWSKRQSLFDSIEDREPASESMGRLRTRHLVGVPVLDFARALGKSDVLGVLIIDRRDQSPPFQPDAAEALERLAVEVSLVLKAITERRTVTVGPGDEQLATLKDSLSGNGGNLKKSADLIGVPYHKARDMIATAGLKDWLAQIREASSPSPDSVLAVLKQTHDLREVGAHFDRDYGELYELTRKKFPGGLRALVNSIGLTWDDVHGAAFQRGQQGKF